MDVDVPEFELRWKMAVRLSQALPLLALLVIVVAVGLNRLHIMLLGVVLGAAISGLMAALAVARSATWTPASGARRETAPSAEPLTST